jgi:hypothetical protein
METGLYVALIRNSLFTVGVYEERSMCQWKTGYKTLKITPCFPENLLIDFRAEMSIITPKGAFPWFPLYSLRTPDFTLRG